MALFTYDPEEYIRHVDLIPAYIDQSALYISRCLNVPLEQAKAFVVKQISPGGLAELVDPEVKILRRDKNGDRAMATTSLTKHLAHITQNDLIMAPSMTVYLNPDQKESLLAEYITLNLTKRKAFKHQMFQAKMAKDKVLQSYYDGLQNSSKIKNNSLSGAHASPSTILFNKSSHSSLTSLCRISASYANASNEQFLAGNRHFATPQIVFTSLVIACQYSDLNLVKQCMDEYDLVYPTVDDVIECIQYSASLYMRSQAMYTEARQFIENMTALERAAFVYMSDMYHLAKHNPGFVREVLDKLSTPAAGTIPLEEAERYMKLIDSAQQDLTVLLCADLMQGRPLYGDGGANDNSVYTTDKPTFCRLGATAKKTLATLDQYRPLIHGLWRPPILPPAIAILPSIMRRVVVTSDTDSTIFTNQYWTEWFTDGDSFCEKAYQIGYTTTYLTSQLVKHKLALMSANLGIVRRHLHKISMKNEYYFPVYSLTPVAKHYFAFRSAQEGNVFTEMETEIKGVHLRDSTAPVAVTKQLKAYMEHCMRTVMERGKLTLDEVFGPVADLEIDIQADLARGGHTYLKALQIKDLHSYVKKEEASNYKHHLFWNEVFGPKYGMAEAPPYGAFKVSVDLESRSKIKQWLTAMDDRELADRLQKWVTATAKDKITTFIVPASILENMGIPKEIMQAMNIRKLTMNMVKPFYLVLASFGIYMAEKTLTRMVSDTYVSNKRRLPIAA